MSPCMSANAAAAPCQMKVVHVCTDSWRKHGTCGSAPAAGLNGPARTAMVCRPVYRVDYHGAAGDQTRAGLRMHPGAAQSCTVGNLGQLPRMGMMVHVAMLPTYNMAWLIHCGVCCN